MDQALINLTDGPSDPPLKPGDTITTKIIFTDQAAGIVEIETPDGPRTHALKALTELYGAGQGAATVDPTSPEFMPLFLCIEEGIVRHSRSDQQLTDAKILLALERLGMRPEADAGGDALAHCLQLDLRLLLSLDNYSRQEVRAAIRKIAKSVARHTRDGGPYGYLDFIRKHLRG